MALLKSTIIALVLIAVAASAHAQQSKAEWAEQIYYTILSRVRYPAEAAKKYQQGTVLVVFRVAADGKLVSRRILESSGHALLDQTALDAIDRSAPFPPFPPDMKDIPEQDLSLPVRFHDNRPQGLRLVPGGMAARIGVP